MIIFDLDVTLANCEHRRHFVEKGQHNNLRGITFTDKDSLLIKTDGTFEILNRIDRSDWEPDWKAYYEACDKDEPIIPSIKVFTDLSLKYAEQTEVHIWTGRCESVKDKTIEWLKQHIGWFVREEKLKMRPIDDLTPLHILKERWLAELFLNDKKNIYTTGSTHGKVYVGPNPIDFVFDSDPESIKMWRRKGIFVFDCCQEIRNDY